MRSSSFSRSSTSTMRQWVTERRNKPTCISRGSFEGFLMIRNSYGRCGTYHHVHQTIKGWRWYGKPNLAVICSSLRSGPQLIAYPVGSKHLFKASKATITIHPRGLVLLQDLWGKALTFQETSQCRSSSQKITILGIVWWHDVRVRDKSSNLNLSHSNRKRAISETFSITLWSKKRSFRIRNQD